ncbi:hypothetical protein VSR68_03350 [Paraburkholderia phymatum]|uniref:hypothetical protein n=1 Tax=Paraburkholderia phymatum TaxID=148447 RepID=UPI003171F160
MSRYYAIRVTDPKTGEILVANLNGKAGFIRVPFDVNTWTYSSLYAGGTPTTLASNNANALSVSFDIPVGFLDAPLANSYVRIDGVSLQEISQGSNLNGLNFMMVGGMAKGLPLANPVQIGPLCQGQILQCFGNWIGKDQYLAIYVQAGGSSATANQTTGNPPTASTLPIPTANGKAANIVFTWNPGQTMQDALVQCLSVPFPQYGISGSINPNLVNSGGMIKGHWFSRLTQLADWVKRASLSMLGGYAPDLAEYMGVHMALQGNTILLFDGTAQTKPKQIYIVDLIGQPTYSQPLQIQLTCVLRGDIKVGDFVAIPQGLLNIGPGAQVGYIPPPPIGGVNTAQVSIAFQGSYLVTGVRHVGDSRNCDGLAWVTTLDLLVTQPYDSGAAVAVQKVLANPNSSQFYLPR